VSADSKTPDFTRNPVALILSAALFIALATANSGGYRYGASDQAFYIPAVAMKLNPALFPRDRAFFAPQMGLWPGGALLGALARGPDGLPVAFGSAYLATLVILFAAAVGLARGLGANHLTVAAFLALLTLKHQITRTGANSLEGYGHPRMLAFALGIAALALLVHRRRTSAAVAIAAAAVIHVTTALWFAVVVVVAALWPVPRRLVGALLLAAVTAVAILTLTTLNARLVVMEPSWIEAIGDRSYLFSGQWPVAVWMLNLGYAAALVAIYRRRRALGTTGEAEAGIVAGLIALVVMFLASVPFTELRVALAVQLQVNRIFWLLDAFLAFYLAWWLVSDLARSKSARLQWAIVGVIVAASAARGAYLLGVAPARPAVEAGLPSSHWTDAMSWLRRRPETWHVLADPQHAVLYGSSVRVAALRDTLLEVGKDPALAIYDREAARRVLERSQVLAGFDRFTTADVRTLAVRYHLDVFVARADRLFDLPILYRNDGFIAYDLR
jgi:hypothetical protein